MSNKTSKIKQKIYPLHDIVDTKPFDGMKIDNSSVLDSLDGRSPCSKCFKSRKYFCYTCYLPVDELKGQLPTVKLPIKIDIIKHKHEIDGKSTAVHAAILASEDVRIFTYPNIPNYEADNKTVLIFPSRNAVSIPQLLYGKIHNTSSDDEDVPKGHNDGTLLKKPLSKIPDQSLLKRNSVTDSLPITRAVFIDSTWNQSRGIYKDPNINKLPSVALQNRISQFWRHQKGSPRWYLATVEAVHQFLFEIHVNAWGIDPDYNGLNSIVDKSIIDQRKLAICNPDSDCKPYKGEYDNLLYFFKHMYEKIHELYDHTQLMAYKRPLM